MVFVPAGPFEMGSKIDDYEKPVHTVMLDAFYIDQYEVTNARFVDFLNEQSDANEMVTALSGIESEYFHLYQRDGVWQIDAGYADHPVVSVSWFDAQAYCEWRGARLPTEAEWEKAARGTDGRTYPWGEGIDCTMANYGSCVGNTAAVGSYLKGVSPYGCLDMAGNVWEQVDDWYQGDYYSVSPLINPSGPDYGDRKVMRGGAWSYHSSNARGAYRTSFNPTSRHLAAVGFRCAVSDPASAVMPTPPSSPLPTAPVLASPSGPVVLIPAGPFEMGDEYHSSGQPIHTVILDAYYIDQYEVTNAQYAACVQTGACQPPGDCRHWGGLTYYDVDKAYHPVACVNWYDAQAYCEWRGGRLPTEAEWEKAARGTDGRTYPWGEDSPDCVKAQYGDCGEGTIPVGSKPAGASPYGVQNMAGNVREWVADWYDEDYYARSPVNSPQGPSSGSSKVRRGGDWTTDAAYLRAGARSEGDPSMRSNRVGFRCVTLVSE
jgi:formylglycine-generating enzyme required for sulfatase activity